MNKKKKATLVTLLSTLVLASTAWIAPKLLSLNAQEKNPLPEDSYP